MEPDIQLICYSSEGNSNYRMLQKGSVSFIHHLGWINYNHIHRLIWETKETAGFAGIVFVANIMSLQKYFYF